MEVGRELSPKQSGRAEQRSREAANAKKQERSSQRSREQRQQPGIPAGDRHGTAAAAQNSGWERAGSAGTAGKDRERCKTRRNHPKNPKLPTEMEQRVQEQQGKGKHRRNHPRILAGSEQRMQEQGKTGRGAKPGGIIPKCQLGWSRKCSRSSERLKTRRNHPKGAENSNSSPEFRLGADRECRSRESQGDTQKGEESSQKSRNPSWDGAGRAAGAGKGKERLQQKKN